MSINLEEEPNSYEIKIPITVTLSIHVEANSKKEAYKKIFKNGVEDESEPNDEDGFYTDDLADDIHVPKWMEEEGVYMNWIKWPCFISAKKAKIEKNKE